MIIGRDGNDAQAPERRMLAREEHLQRLQKMVESGETIFATAMLDEEDNMVGSVMILNYQSREQVDNYLRNEPYIIKNVWQDLEIRKCAVPPLFMKK